METNTVYLQQVALLENKNTSSTNDTSSNESVTNIELSELKQSHSDQYTYQIVKICQEKPWMGVNNNARSPIPLPLYQSYAIATNSVNNPNFCNKPGLMFQKVCPDVKNNNSDGVLIPMIMEKENSDPLDLTLNSVEASSRNLSEVLAKDYSENISSPEGIAPGNCLEIDNNTQQYASVSGFSRKRGRKRKYAIHIDDKGDYFQCASSNHAVMPCEDAKQTEVLVAAKSLFSKRTRTLYHWIHPEMSKAQIKSDVNAAWELLPVEQREFYVSQVLGRFGFPQCSLMINPQLKKLPNEDQASQPTCDNDETRNAVSSLIMSENREDWQQAFNRPNRKKKHSGRQSTKTNNGVKNLEPDVKVNHVKLLGDAEDDFQDDPELSREFQQFKWTLLYNNNEFD